MAPSTHHRTATPTVATTVATQAQGAIDEQLCLQQWVLTLPNWFCSVSTTGSHTSSRSTHRSSHLYWQGIFVASMVFISLALSIIPLR